MAFHLGLPHHRQILYHLSHHESPSVGFLIVSYFKFDLWVNVVKIKLLIVQSYLTLCDTTDLDPRLFCPWNSPGKNTGGGCHFLLQGIFPTQRWNPGLLHCRKILYCLRHQGSPWVISSMWDFILLPKPAVRLKQYLSSMWSPVNNWPLT